MTMNEERRVLQAAALKDLPNIEGEEAVAIARRMSLPAPLGGEEQVQPESQEDALEVAVVDRQEEEQNDATDGLSEEKKQMSAVDATLSMEDLTHEDKANPFSALQPQQETANESWWDKAKDNALLILAFVLIAVLFGYIVYCEVKG